MSVSASIPRVLVVAGSDSGGGAGIQADIKTLMAFGAHAATAITAITAQNTQGVTQVEIINPQLLIAQVDAVLSDIGADAIKIGMIGSAVGARALADRLAEIDIPIVFDPVIVSTAGSILADQETIAAFEKLMKMATLITPNLPELRALSPDGAFHLAQRTGANILVKGGHGVGERLVDTLVMPDGSERCWEAARIETTQTHGTGCSLASAIAAGLAKGDTLQTAITAARQYVRAAISAAPGIGKGAGPLGHAAAAGLYPDDRYMPTSRQVFP